MNSYSTLNKMKPGERATIHSINCTGSMHRRLLDLGLIQNTKVECVGSSPGGDPSAYVIRGAVIAIRSEDSQQIQVKQLTESHEVIPDKHSNAYKMIAIAGNPNVGKSTVFNALTGMKQHTGNWPGKTVVKAEGYCTTNVQSYLLVDTPGTYSLMAHSAEEEVARDFICFENPEATIIVCDATCLERNLNLVLQTIETGQKVIVCVNLMDEARRKNIHVDLPALAQRLGVPVIGMEARQKKNLKGLTDALDLLDSQEISQKPIVITYEDAIESAIQVIEKEISPYVKGFTTSRWLSIHLLESDCDNLLQDKIVNHLGLDILNSPGFLSALTQAQDILRGARIEKEQLKNLIVSTLVATAEKVCTGIITYENKDYNAFDRRIDRVLTNKLTGYPIMLCMLALVFWITITGANYPSGWLADGLLSLQNQLTQLFTFIQAPDWLYGSLVLGVYRVLAWVVSVMLPPMAIFFPLFTLLEDAGYLPRVAYNLDKTFKRCSACGKQALTMCMGFGCNAAGVIGCRIIDSPRERFLAILTNNFVPCNGRFPTLIAILTMFFIGTSGSALASLGSAILLTLVIVIGILTTFFITRLLSKTILKGMPSSFTLELPPYRKPQIGKVIIRSIMDRTLFVLGRAIIVAAPAGLFIWLMANLYIDGQSLLSICAEFLNPFGMLMGLDGVILLAFILGFPANEIVIPIIIMAYLSQGSILELDSLDEMRQLFISNGWTYKTAICTMLFSLMHWPCSTTLLTIKKETGSWKWTALAAAIPTATGIILCILFTFIAGLFN